MLPTILFMDKKLFHVEEAYKPQNCRVLDKNNSSIPKEKKTVVRKQWVASGMVWVGVTSCGKKMPLIFIEKGAKINKDIYLAMLRDQVLPWLQTEFGNLPYVAQQAGDWQPQGQDCPGLVVGEVPGLLG
jgi:hypothetical protein